MRTNNMNLEALETLAVRFACGFASTVVLLLLMTLLLLVAGFAGSSFAQDAKPKMFTSPRAASIALFQAVQKDDEQALEAILGAGKDVTSSSDEVQDKAEREQFTQKYQEMHRLVREPDGTTILYIGAENWPFPIPLVSKSGNWYFDSDRGKQEILFRRIGKTRRPQLRCVRNSLWQSMINAQKQPAKIGSPNSPKALALPLQIPATQTPIFSMGITSES